MEWQSVYLRFEKLRTGDYVVCRLEEEQNWNKTGFATGVYEDGKIYDAWCKEDDIMPKEDWDITDIVQEFIKLN